MRRFLFPLLLVSSALAPTLANAQDSAADRRAAREQERADRSAERELQRAERSSQREPSRPDFTARSDRQQAADSRVAGGGRIEVREERIDVRNSSAASSSRVRTQVVNPSLGPVAAGRMEMRQADREQRRAQYQAMREARRNAAPPVVSSTPRPNAQPPAPTIARPAPAPHWNTNWRSNTRYDWHNYRNRHRWLFNLGFYYDPFGWGYSPYSIGWRMWPSYYSNSYWLNDPWQYRLPYAPPGTRWIRYFDDAILVDMWSGQVVDVIYDFFW